MSELSAKSFLGLVQKSGVVPADQLKQALAELSRRAAGKPVHLDQLTQFLIGEGLITQWHYDKLLTRKYKGFFVGQYRLLSLLGTGGMSTVYLAEHTLSGQRRAIKVLPRARVNDKSYLDRFLREGRAAASLSHPNIVRIYDLANEEDVYYMVMEYVPGVDLHQKIQQEGPASIEDALKYLEQAAAGLAHAHSKQIVHRDIKPANLLLTSEGSVKLLDLGLALFREDPESLTLLHNEKVMGTADYLAPEQALNSHNVDPRADLYSLGCTFYYLLTGQPPFPEGSIAQRIAMHQSREPKPVRELRPDCPLPVEALCQRMMKKSPDERLQSCERVIQAIEKCRQQIGVTALAAAGIAASAERSSESSPTEERPVASPPQPPPLVPPGKPSAAKTPQRKEKWQGEPAPLSSATHAPAPRPSGSEATAPAKPNRLPQPGAATAPSPAVTKPAAPAGGSRSPKAGGADPAAGKASATAASPAPAKANPKLAPSPRVAVPDVAVPGGTDQAALDTGLASLDVGELASLPSNRTRKRGRTSSLKANLVVGAIVLVCFLVLVGMMIFLARVFGNG
ncbi:MAG: serine/threonine protein kinase [Planctomycetota bacterium]